MTTFTFFMLRHVSTEQHNLLWQESYKSIRLYFPDYSIVIIDNNSDKTKIKFDFELENCSIINAEYPESRLFSPFYEFLKLSNIERAVIIHDGVIFNRFVDFGNFKYIKFLWHFITHNYDNYNLEIEQLKLLKNNEECIKVYNNKNWYGCLGCITAIDREFINLLEEKYGISNLKTHIKNQNDAIAFERVLAVLSYTEHPDISQDISYEGDISNMKWGTRIEEFKKDTSIESDKPFFKLFGARK